MMELAENKRYHLLASDAACELYGRNYKPWGEMLWGYIHNQKGEIQCTVSKKPLLLIKYLLDQQIRKYGLEEQC